MHSKKNNKQVTQLSVKDLKRLLGGGGGPGEGDTNQGVGQNEGDGGSGIK